MTELARLRERVRKLGAENRAYKDRQARYGFTDDAGQAVELSWMQAHKHHKDTPYIGCVLCYDRFVELAPVLEILRAIDRGAKVDIKDSETKAAISSVEGFLREHGTLA